MNVTNTSSLAPETEELFYEDPYPLPKWMIDFSYYLSRVGVRINISIGIIGNVLSLLAFLKQAKETKAYYHQIAIVLTDLVSVSIALIAIVGDYDLGVWENEAPKFVQKSAILLNFFYIGFPLSNIVVTASLGIVFGVSVDRYCALTMPMEYQLWNKKKICLFLAGVSYIVGLVTSIHGCFMMYTTYQQENQMYLLVYNAGFNQNLFATVMNYAQVCVRVVLILGVFVMAVVISRKYKKFRQNQAQLTASDEAQRKKESARVKNLTRLLLAQATLVLLGMTPLLVLYVLVYGFQFDFWSDVGTFFDRLANFAGTAMGGWNFLVYLSMSNEFRRAFVSVVKRTEYTITPTSGGGGSKAIRTENSNVRVIVKPAGEPGDQTTGSKQAWA